MAALSPPFDGSTKRRKITRACDACKAKKKRCSGTQPCPSCERAAKPCTYLASYTRGRFKTPPPPLPLPPPPRAGLDALSWRPLPPDPERILVDDPPSRGASLEPEATLDGHYLGPDSGIAWLRRAWRKLGQAHHEMGVEETSAEAGNRSSGSIFTYGDKETPVDHDAGFTFPSPERADYLVGRYFEYAAPTYRFLHRPTLVSWLAAMQDPTTASSVSPARQAVVLLVFATATIYELNKHDHAKPDAAIRTEGESYQRAAREHLSREAGAPTLESAQARFALCHFLLSTSRPNEAWFTFGTTAQLALALGLHRRQRERAAPSNGARSAETGDVLVARECRRRLFWSMYTLDTYLSVMFGRPRLLRDEDITQPLPQALNDEDIAPEAGSAAAAPRPASPASDADCVMHAAIFHARLARILSRAIALQQRQRRHRRRSGKQRALSAAAGLHAELDAWKARLPPFLSGAIRPSSLIPVFRRQATVLQIAYAHAVMFVGRGFLVGGDHLASATLKAASSALNLVRTFVAEKQPFPAFWFSQHIAFNALAVLWVWVLERRERSELRHRGELSQRGELNSLRGQALLALADTVHGHLAAVGEHSAPCLRYGIVLRELRDEVGGVGVGVGGGGGEGGGADGSRSTALMEGDPHGKPLYAPAAAELRPSGLLLQSQSQQQQQAEPSTATATVTTGGGGDWSNNINGASAAAVGDVAGVDADADADAPFDLGGCGWGGWGLGVEFWPRLDALPLGETF
ncbi:uncharacterized protein K452DRAFT_245934 [Aplosporella prunicola CBS 121167]|uniref:Zn(2)-C6 fungal-type domain-containing protein n=1 Tax=Aplosporella prunicola CBS 121167 TaxID=1176127 RepID=A0A6A6BPN9_9PEZI|nr:uncharacterized protein K452DRAFT_245934 [Aplosporella prunicola CBS 121167]KAF2144797.1 hypothetical protein K452DRAFT_245934 [Aplosporella prunicola CBS 121167]